LNYAQAVKGQNDGRGSGIIESRCVIELVEALGVLESSTVFEKSDREGIKKWLSEFRIWMLDSKNGKHEAAAKNNHGAWYEAQIISLSLYLGMNDFVKEFSGSIKSNRLEKQFEPDGSQPEELKRTKALSYSYFNLLAVMTSLKLAENVGVKYADNITPDGRSLKKGVDFLYPFSAGEKEWPYKQISPADKEGQVKVLLFSYYFFEDKKYLELARKLDRDLLKKEMQYLCLFGASE